MTGNYDGILILFIFHKYNVHCKYRGLVRTLSPVLVYNNSNISPSASNTVNRTKESLQSLSDQTMETSELIEMLL